MSDPKLKEALSKLEEALKSLDSSDTESRERLKHLINVLEEKVQTPQKGEQGQLLETFKEKAAYFEGAHPVISSILEEIVGILTRLGI